MHIEKTSRIRPNFIWKTLPWHQNPQYFFLAKLSKSAVPKLKAPEKTDREIHTSNRLILLLTLTPGLMAAVTV